MNKNSIEFDKELSLIDNQELKEFVKEVLDSLPDYFREIGASTSKKYHPAYTIGKGGLVRHTKACVWIAKDLLRAELPFANIKECDKYSSDIVYSSLLLHDGLKCGMWEDRTAFNHPLLISEFIKEKALEKKLEHMTQIEQICKCIESHMGKWNTNKDYSFLLPTPKTGIEQLVHLCDYIASRKNIHFMFDEE